MSYQSIDYEVQDHIATIALNRPETLNALTNGMMAEIVDALKQVERNRDVRTLVLTGRGRGFCSGQDLKALGEKPAERDIAEHLDRYYHPLIKRLANLEKPTIAMVNGVAAGAGMSLALACDLRIAVVGVRFSQTFVRIGLVPDSGSSYFLPRLIGPARALEMAMTGMMVDDETALQWGLINRLVTDEQLQKETYDLARTLASGPPLALGMIKREMAYGASHGLDQVLEREKDFQVRAAQTADHQTAVEAFFAKKSPVFRGQ
ncbi:MAG: enoyl-CoA hydratase [Sulfobacillus acidophilus]|uniref:Enoyl-CoA hydratase n=1 Tax=Sulfobacillus acidophilus TaxID=53633 RepID=A0A2T2WLP4_9FIRM|nr:MAG: enoyl-CoA hydratase [Sulfobacillus acidophilus]